jgi:hypothetical protein
LCNLKHVSCAYVCALIKHKNLYIFESEAQHIIESVSVAAYFSLMARNRAINQELKGISQLPNDYLVRRLFLLATSLACLHTHAMVVAHKEGRPENTHRRIIHNQNNSFSSFFETSTTVWADEQQNYFCFCLLAEREEGGGHIRNFYFPHFNLSLNFS